MLDTGFRQVRMGLAMAFGRRINPGNIGRLVSDVLATTAEFGPPGAEALQVLGEPEATEQARREFAASALRATAARLAAQSPFYRERLADVPKQKEKQQVLAWLRTVPVTLKQDLVSRPADFQCADVERYIATRTTGTTGRPAEIWLSRYEVELWSALGALAAVIRGELRRDDVIQVNLSSRATAAMQLTAGSARLAQVGYRSLGIVSPDESLEWLTGEPAVTVLTTVPSYLAELVSTARRAGYGPGDFRLRRITASGEVLSPGLAEAAAATFGVSRIEDSYSMTEVAPVTGVSCDQRHMHFDLSPGMTELIDLTTGQPAAPGELGTLVISPYFPYRDCSPVFRYDTRDVARCLPEEPLDCELAGIPATSHIQGKAEQLLRLPAGRVVTARQLIEAIEALPAEPWPARYRAEADGGRIVLTLPAAAIDGLTEAEAVRHFSQADLDVELRLVGDEQATALRRTRSDLRETSFAGQLVLAGA